MTEHGPGESDAAPTPPKPPRKRGGRKGTPPRGKKASRPTDAEVQRRTLEVMQLLIEGHRRRDILQHVAKDKKWRDVAKRTVDDYIARATGELSKIADEPRATAKSKARARYELVIRKATEAKQWEVVRKANRDLARLDGLEPGLRVQHSGAIETPVSGSVEHTHTHHAAGSIEDRATRVTDLLGLAAQRRQAAQNAGNN
jgi:hypothetical protein